MAAAALALVLAATPSQADFTMPEYHGPHYTPKAEAFLKCAALRESSGRFKADGKYGSGAWQFTQPTWDHYAAMAGFDAYVGKRAATAPPLVQTVVAYVTVNPLPDKPGLEGKHHWSPRHALTVGKVIEAC